MSKNDILLISMNIISIVSSFFYGFFFAKRKYLKHKNRKIYIFEDEINSQHIKHLINAFGHLDFQEIKKFINDRRLLRIAFMGSFKKDTHRLTKLIEFLEYHNIDIGYDILSTSLCSFTFKNVNLELLITLNSYEWFKKYLNNDLGNGKTHAEHYFNYLKFIKKYFLKNIENIELIRNYLNKNYTLLSENIDVKT